MTVEIPKRLVDTAWAGVNEGVVGLAVGGFINNEVSYNPIATALTLSSITVAGISAGILLLNEHISKLEKKNNS